ncbi:HTH domain-containing protein [Eubacteriales bacterium KG125]
MGDKRNNDIKKSTTEGANQNNQDNYTMTDTEAQVLNKLSSEPVSRSELSNWIGIDDRAVRKAIERLRLQGYPICSTSQKKGYWLSDNKEEIDKVIKEFRSKALKMLVTARNMEHGKKYI